MSGQPASHITISCSHQLRIVTQRLTECCNPASHCLVSCIISSVAWPRFARSSSNRSSRTRTSKPSLASWDMKQLKVIDRGWGSPHLSLREVNLASAPRSFCASLSLSWRKSSLSCNASRRRTSQPTARACSAVTRLKATRSSSKSVERVLFDTSASSLLRSA